MTPHTIDSHVIVTSIIGTFHCTDVEQTTTTARQWFRDSPVPLADPVYAFGWAADSALERTEHDGLARNVWLIIDGRVADHAHIR